MTEKSEGRTKLIPALRGIFGSWVYYSAVFRLKEIVDRIELGEEIHPNKNLWGMIERETEGKGATEFAESLLNQNRCFLNSFALAVYGGEPKWFALSEVTAQTPEFLASTLDEDKLATIGFLSLSGEEKFFVLNGQDRLADIKNAFHKDASLGEEEISALLLARQETATSRQRTRHLLDSLHKRSKPESKASIIALDEDDTMAIVCRRMVEESPWFLGDRIDYQAANVSLKEDNPAFTTIGTLYDLLTILFCKVYGAKNESLKYYRLSDEDLNQWHEKGFAFFKALYKYFQEFREFCDAGDEYPKVTAKYRNKDGGSVLFYSIGLEILVETIWKLKGLYPDLDMQEVVGALSNLEWSLSMPPFSCTIWDADTGEILAPSKQLCRDLILFMSGDGTSRSSIIKKISKQKHASISEAERVIDLVSSLDIASQFKLARDRQDRC